MGKELEKQRALEAEVMRQQQKNTEYYEYKENEAFTFDGQPVFSVLDYWRFQYGQLMNQQEYIAEFLVSKALGIRKAENVSFWTGYDLSYCAKRIEVKSSVYVHPWNKKRTSKVRTFSIAPSSNLYWSGKKDENGKKLARQNEIYVFCLNTNRDINNADPLIIDDWDFYVIPTFVIDEMCSKYGNPNQKTISLGVVRKLSDGSVKWDQLHEKINEAIDRVDRHIIEIDERECD
ncbi:MAG: hypothetical protein IJ662_02760 [Clostridia bacterium]|nr:hypothetical protein [Clostridia bacterium]